MKILSNLKKISIYGMGLMGTSLAYSIKNHPDFNGKVFGIVKSTKSKEWIEQQAFIDKVILSEENPKEMIIDSDLIVIGLPVLNTIEFLKEIAHWDFKGIITDMSSTRYLIESTVRELEKHNSLKFIGSHPICGSELAGPQGYVKDLYLNKLCIIINRLQEKQSIDREEFPLEFVRTFWQELGMYTLEIDAESHDYLLSYLSHSPHILSSILTRTIGKDDYIIKKNKSSPIPIYGGGLRDMIRIAGSNPKMWYDIICTNKQNILKSLKEFQEELNEFINILEHTSNSFEDIWFRWQNQAKEYRDQIYGI